MRRLDADLTAIFGISPKNHGCQNSLFLFDFIHATGNYLAKKRVVAAEDAAFRAIIYLLCGRSSVG